MDKRGNPPAQTKEKVLPNAQQRKEQHARNKHSAKPNDHQAASVI